MEERNSEVTAEDFDNISEGKTSSLTPKSEDIKINKTTDNKTRSHDNITNYLPNDNGSHDFVVNRNKGHNNEDSRPVSYDYNSEEHHAALVAQRKREARAIEDAMAEQEKREAYNTDKYRSKIPHNPTYVSKYSSDNKQKIPTDKEDLFRRESEIAYMNDRTPKGPSILPDYDKMAHSRAISLKMAEIEYKNDDLNSVDSNNYKPNSQPQNDREILKEETNSLDNLNNTSNMEYEVGHIIDVMKLETNQLIPGKIIGINSNKLFKIDFGNGNIEDDVHLSRIKSPENRINQWTPDKDNSLKIMLSKLKFNREVTRFYFYKICKEEGYWSWMLIILATFTSTITLGNNITDEPFTYYFIIIKVLLTIIAACTTLAAAWIKKQSYIQRINNCDRYLQKVAHLIEAFDVILIHNPENRITYSEFCDKLLPLYKNLSITPPMSPTEQKFCEFRITVNHPEIISRDNDDENKLWPWFEIPTTPIDHDNIENDDSNEDTILDKDTNLNIPLTKFGESVIRSYIAEKNTKERFSIFSCFGCMNPNPNNLVIKYYEYFGYDYDLETKSAIIPIAEDNFVKSIKGYEKLVNNFNRNPVKSYNKGDVLILNGKFDNYLNKIINKFKLPADNKAGLIGIIEYPKILENKLVYLCHITSKNENIRQLLNSKGVGQRVIKDDFIDHDKTVLLTYDQITSHKNLVNDSLV
jgi:hypothetical protein